MHQAGLRLLEGERVLSSAQQSVHTLDSQGRERGKRRGGGGDGKWKRASERSVRQGAAERLKKGGNKTVYTIPDDTEFRATSIAWKLPYFELKKYITKIRLPSQNGIKIQV